ncbi:efflux RND transporter periplasmic adaptor subunit [Candidatus Methylacidiphilum fumarolicum]|nr:efflux RND transporter periplasmic adaptor subunit [Candidatus Methylacidiphilum fumarolicum]MBW6415770.1 efflux RND transporter periplasmic adaptor subunit [Candidatus Methylacidiphilum fumarolicum]TFE72266.1 efflux RND transporter periplasmic adaptor subunit [Candidatus Methylacidiphilum fumarolicum]TFE72495.1 efflux RND transporter periplasmic adaptor subunit [Candidatus Methylacidiphilum fumarolicum]
MKKIMRKWFVFSLSFCSVFMLWWPMALKGEGLFKDSPEASQSESLEPLLEEKGSYQAVLLPIADLRLSAKASGILEKFFFEEGACVKKGDIIAQLNSEEEKAEIARAEAEIGVHEAEVEKAEVEFKRIEGLYKEEIVSPKQFEEAKYNYQMAQNKLKEARALLITAQNRLESKIVRSPIEGVFFKKLRNEGESVERLEPVARVIDVSELQMVIYCESKYFGKLHPKDKLSVKLVDGPFAGKVVETTVVYVDPFLDPASGTFRVKLVMPASKEVVAGITAEVVIPENKEEFPSHSPIIGLNVGEKIR